MGRKSKYQSKVKPYLEDIKRLVAEGAMEKEICEMLGVATSTFYEYKLRYPEFKEAVEKPRKELIMKVRNALIEKALGRTYEEKKQYLTKDKVTGKETLRVETYTKYMPPDTNAIAMLLRNYDDGYRDRDELYYEFKKAELELKEEAQKLDKW